MRLLFTILLVFLSFGYFSQNYQLINSSKEVHFGGDPILSLRIDSIATLGTDTTFYNHKVLKIDYSNYPCEGFISDTSWIGNGITAQVNGDYVFRNLQNEPILIKSTAALNNSWVLYTFSNGDYIEAKITSITQQSVLGIQDSVKVITLQAKDNTNANIIHDVNSKEIKLAKNTGIITLFAFRDFPSNVTLYSIVGSSNPDNGTVNLKAEDIFNYDVGDEFHYQEDYQQPYSYFFTFYKRILKVLDKNVSINLDTIIYTYERNQMKINNNSTTVYNPDTTYIFDTISSSVILSQWDLLNKLTSEPIYGVNTPTGMAGYLNFDRNYSHLRRQKELVALWEYISDTCWSQMIDGSSTTFFYFDGLGGGYFNDGFGTMGGGSRFILVYYSKGNETWGTPLTINNTQTSVYNINSTRFGIKIFPNPFNDITTITIDNFAASKEVYFKLFNSLGKEINSIKLTDNTYTLQKNNLASGIYFYRIFDKTNQLSNTGKLIIE